MKILLLEDDHLQEEAITEAILDGFPGTEIDVICTELEFRERIDSIVEFPPNLIILDGMIRWTDPSEVMDQTPIPPEVREGGTFQSGRRCQQLLAERAPSIPFFFYTILDRKDLSEAPLPADVCYLQKKDDPKKLIDKIRRVLQKARNGP